MREHIRSAFQAADYVDSSPSDIAPEVKKVFHAPVNQLEIDFPEVPRLSGTMLTLQQRVAFLEYSDGTTFVVSKGDKLGQFVVAALYDGRITMTSMRGSVTLEVQASGTPQAMEPSEMALPKTGQLVALVANMRMVRRRIEATMSFQKKAIHRKGYRNNDVSVALLTRGL